MKLLKNSIKILSFIEALLISLLCILLIVQLFAFSNNFYSKEFKKLDTTKKTNISSEALDRGTEALIEFMKGQRENIYIDVEIDDEIVPLFNENEQLHMDDVRILFVKVSNTTHLIFYFVIGLALLIILLDKSSKTQIIYIFIKGFFISSISILIIAVVSAIVISSDFSGSWDIFHEMLFTNELWLLNPATDNMILLLTNQFFIDMIISIAIYSTSLFIITNLILMIIYRKILKRSKEN